MNQRPGTIESLRRAMMSWRMASVSLLSFSSGLPLGLIWIAIPDWMRSAGMDIRVVGLITLAQAPWTLYWMKLSSIKFWHCNRKILKVRGRLVVQFQFR